MTKAERRGYDRAMRDAQVTLEMFAAGAKSRHESEQSSFSLGWSEAAATALECLTTFPRPPEAP